MIICDKCGKKVEALELFYNMNTNSKDNFEIGKAGYRIIQICNITPKKIKNDDGSESIEFSACDFVLKREERH